MLRQLVVNADDLGLTVGVNNGIFDAHDRGILTSASLFAMQHGLLPEEGFSTAD